MQAAVLAMTTYAELTVEMTANIEAFQRTIDERLQPALQRFAADLTRWYASLPGMPYTKPDFAGWQAEQMRADQPK